MGVSLLLALPHGGNVCGYQLCTVWNLWLYCIIFSTYDVVHPKCFLVLYVWTAIHKIHVQLTKRYVFLHIQMIFLIDNIEVYWKSSRNIDLFRQMTVQNVPLLGQSSMCFIYCWPIRPTINIWQIMTDVRSIDQIILKIIYIKMTYIIAPREIHFAVIFFPKPREIFWNLWKSFKKV